MVPRPLATLSEGESGKLVEIRSGWSLRQRLIAMGFEIGCRIRVVKRTGRGPMIAEVKGIRIGLGMGEAMKMMVETGD
jgi:ferrous iron transport protein A